MDLVDDAMSGPDLVVAVDGGNTKTIAVVIDRNTGVIGVGHGGCTDIYNATTSAEACAELSRSVRAAFDDAGCLPNMIRAGVFSLAGVDWPEDHDYLRAHLVADFDFDFTPLVVNDSIGGLRVGGPDWEGVSVICGTGNAVGARHRDGKCFHVGFWPDVVGSLQLSTDALNAVHRHQLGLGPATSLTARALEAYDCNDPVEVLHRFTSRGGYGRHELVRMSPIVLDEADRRDPVALEIVTVAGDHLGKQARVCADRVGLEIEGTPVVMGGGVFRHPTTLLEHGVMAKLPGAVACRMQCPPVLGAMMAALDLIRAEPHREELHASLVTHITRIAS